jgi:UDP-glucose 4-epimerase
MTSTVRERVVVTGGAGFLGSHVAEALLQSGREVVVLDDFSNGKMLHLDGIRNDPRLTIVRGDVTNKADVARAFDGSTAVIHLSVLDLRRSIKEPEHVNRVIVDGTLNCLEAALKNRMRVFLNCSSSEVFGSAAYVPMDEQHPLRPETPYAAAKVAQDMYVFSFGRTYQLPWVTLRPFNMYGPHSHWQSFRGELIPKMIVRAMNGKPLVIFGDGSQTRDFIYVKDAARAMVAVLDNESVRGRDLNICSGEETSIKTIATMICKSFGLDPASAIEVQPARPGDVARHLGDNRNFKAVMGFGPQVGIEQGLAETVAWFRGLPFSPQELLAGEVLRNWE